MGKSSFKKLKCDYIVHKINKYYLKIIILLIFLR